MSKPAFVVNRDPNPETGAPFPVRPEPPASYKSELDLWKNARDAWRHGYYFHKSIGDYTVQELEHNREFVASGKPHRYGVVTETAHPLNAPSDNA